MSTYVNVGRDVSERLNIPFCYKRLKCLFNLFIIAESFNSLKNNVTYYCKTMCCHLLFPTVTKVRPAI